MMCMILYFHVNPLATCTTHLLVRAIQHPHLSNTQISLPCWGTSWRACDHGSNPRYQTYSRSYDVARLSETMQKCHCAHPMLSPSPLVQYGFIACLKTLWPGIFLLAALMDVSRMSTVRSLDGGTVRLDCKQNPAWGLHSLRHLLAPDRIFFNCGRMCSVSIPLSNCYCFDISGLFSCTLLRHDAMHAANGCGFHN